MSGGSRCEQRRLIPEHLGNLFPPFHRSIDFRQGMFAAVDVAAAPNRSLIAPVLSSEFNSREVSVIDISLFQPATLRSFHNATWKK